MRSLVLVAVAAAQAHAGGIVLESYAGPRPDDAAEIVDKLGKELGPRGFQGGKLVGDRFESEVSRPPMVKQGLPLDFSDRVEQGHKAWVAGRFDEAARVLSPLVTLAHDNPGALLDMNDKAPRDRLLKAMTDLAISQLRSGDQASAKATMGELLRGWPDAAISRGTYGAEAAQLYDDVKRAMIERGRGRLIVTASDANAVVFIDEHSEGFSGVTKDNLFAGEYRVMIQVGPMVSRSHRAIVKAGEDTRIEIDLAFDQAVHTGTWTGLTFASGSERDKHEAAFAAGFAKAIRATAVSVVGIDESRERPALVGSLINLASAREARRAALALDPPPPEERVRALARFLAGDEPEKGLEVLVDKPIAKADVPVATVEEHATTTSSSPWKWVTGVGAVGALVTGGVLLHYNGKCQDTACANVYDFGAPGWISIGGGAVLAAVTVYLFVHGHHTTVVPTQGGAVVGWATAF